MWLRLQAVVQLCFNPPYGSYFIAVLMHLHTKHERQYFLEKLTSNFYHKNFMSTQIKYRLSQLCNLIMEEEDEDEEEAESRVYEVYRQATDDIFVLQQYLCYGKGWKGSCNTRKVTNEEL